MTRTSKVVRLSATLAVGLTMASLLTSDARAAFPQNYTLLCRGGGRLDMGIHPDVHVLTMTYMYSKQTPATGEQAIGTCRWTDRVLSAAEPNGLRILPSNDDERFISEQVADCLRDSACRVKLQASANGSVLLADMSKDFSFTRVN